MGEAVGVSAGSPPRCSTVLAALLALGAAGCASGGSAAPPETVSGSFALVRIGGTLLPLDGGGAPAGECPASGSGSVELSGTRRFALTVRQRSACGGDVGRDLRGTYVRRGEHLGFEARLPDGSTVRFHGTTNDTTVLVRLSGAELHFGRGGR